MALVELCAKRAERIEVEVDGAITDTTATKVRNKRFTQLVKKRAAKQDGNTTRASVGINLGEVSALDPTGVKFQNPVRKISDPYRVSFKKATNNCDIADHGHVLENAG
jgi:hypothetical protein